MGRFEGTDPDGHIMQRVSHDFGTRLARHSIRSQAPGGAQFNMTENERRNSDILTREDMFLRGFSVVGLVSMFLLVLLLVNP